MRRIAAGLLLLALTAIVPARAIPPRRVSGSVTIPTGNLPGETPFALARCETVTNGRSSASFGFVIDLLPEEGDGLHTFELVDGNMSAVDGLITEPANFDVAFYADLGSCGDAANPPPSVRFQAPLTDQGTVPDGARYAVVTMSGKVLAGFDLFIAG